MIIIFRNGEKGGKKFYLDFDTTENELYEEKSILKYFIAQTVIKCQRLGYFRLQFTFVAS